MPSGACSSRVSRAVNGAMERFQENKSIRGWQVSPGSRSLTFAVLSLDSRIWLESCSVACRSFWMRKESCSSRVSRAVNGTLVEVSGKTQHSGLGCFPWEQGPDICSFEA